MLCWLSAGPWRLALGGRTWIVDRVECDLTRVAMRVPFSLFAFALVRLALVRAVAFNRPYTHDNGDRMTETDLRFRVGVWSGTCVDEAAPGNFEPPPRTVAGDGPRFRL